jgi:hypothetical protein
VVEDSAKLAEELKEERRTVWNVRIKSSLRAQLTLGQDSCLIHRSPRATIASCPSDNGRCSLKTSSAGVIRVTGIALG